MRSNFQIGSGCRIDYWRLRSLNGFLSIGKESDIHCRIDFDSPSGRVLIGERCYIGASHFVCHSKIEIEDDVIISWGVTIVDHNSHSVDWKYRKNDVSDWKIGKKDWNNVTILPVHIGKKSWIGFGATILKGVTIGEGAVIGAKAVVTKDVLPYTVVAGNPAKVIKVLERNDENKR